MTNPKSHPLDALPDSDLVSCAKDGNPECFASLYARYDPMVQRRLMRLLSPTQLDEVEDVEQETFLKAWRHIGQFQGKSSFRTWLTSIAINEARMLHRRMGYSKRLESLDRAGAMSDEGESRPKEVVAPGPDVETLAMLDEALEALMKLVGELQASYREVVRMRLGGLTEKEAAVRLGIPLSTVKSRLHRVRRLLEMHRRERGEEGWSRHGWLLGREDRERYPKGPTGCAAAGASI